MIGCGCVLMYWICKWISELLLGVSFMYFGGCVVVFIVLWNAFVQGCAFAWTFNCNIFSQLYILS